MTKKFITIETSTDDSTPILGIARNDYNSALADLEKMYEQELDGKSDSEIEEKDFDTKNGEAFIRFASSGETISFTIETIQSE